MGRTEKEHLKPLMRMFSLFLILPLLIVVVEVGRHGPEFITLLLSKFILQHTEQLQ